MKKLIILAAIGFIFWGCSDNSTEPVMQDNIKQFIDIVNEHREELGLNKLIWDEQLAKVAYNHSKDMSNKNYFSHVSPDGKTPADRLRGAGVEYTTYGENILMGTDDAKDAFTLWINSEGHRENIERSVFTHHGVGFVVEGNYWTHVFAKLK